MENIFKIAKPILVYSGHLRRVHKTRSMTKFSRYVPGRKCIPLLKKVPEIRQNVTPCKYTDERDVELFSKYGSSTQVRSTETEEGSTQQIPDDTEGDENKSIAKGLEEICANYSKAQGSYVAWETDINLGPPKVWNKPAPYEDRHLLDYYNSLQYSLYETGNPETIDRTAQPRRLNNKEDVNVVLLSSPVECIGILLEGGNQSPDGFHLVLSSSWLSKTPAEVDPCLMSLWLHKSVTFHTNGASYIDEFQPPRRVSYFVNYFTDNITSSHRNDGADIEKNLDCPMSSSIKLCELVDDKVWTRDVMACVGMEIPESLVFRRNPARTVSSHKGKIKTLQFDSYSLIDKCLVEKEVSNFSSRLRLCNVRKIVVKPSGPRYLGSVGVSFHSVSDIPSIVRATEELLMEIDAGCSVLVEEFVELIGPLHAGVAPCKEVMEYTVPLDSGTEKAGLWSADEHLGFRVRSTVCRDHDDTPVTTLINCSVAAKCSPINGDNSVCQSLDTTLLAYNVLDDNIRRDLERHIRTQSAHVLEMIMDREKLLTDNERGAARGQTDVIGIDMLVTNTSGKLTPVGIEVNSHDCTINTQLYDFMLNLGRSMIVPKQSSATIPNIILVHKKLQQSKNVEQVSNTCMSLQPSARDTLESEVSESAINTNSDRYNSDYRPDTDSRRHRKCRSRIQETRYYSGDVIGQSVRPLVRNMISRSQRYMMEGKQIIVIGGGNFSKRNIWPDAEKYGIKIILVDSNQNTSAKDFVHHFIYYNFDDHQKDFVHACNIFNLISTSGVLADGCVTFWEDCVPLAAIICDILGTRGSSHEAALTAKKKSRTQHVLTTRKGDIPHWPRTYLYASKTHHIDCEKNASIVASSLQFPAILKLEHGSSAVGVSVVETKDDLIDRYKQISGRFRTESDFPGIGLGHDNTMVVMEFHEGSEHDVDIIMYDRKLIGAFISDNGPTRRPYFTETAAVMPSILPDDKQAQLIVAAYQCCTEIGLSDGTFNVELMMTSIGPKLIEINARMGGFYLRDWIKHIYGVDIMLSSLMISSGIKPYVPKHLPDEYLMGIMIIPSAHAHLFRDKQFRNRLRKMHDNGEIIFTQFDQLNEPHCNVYEEPIGNIAAPGTTAEEAKYKLMKICKSLNIVQDDYPVEQFVKYF